jgi:hypothetical protein
MEKLFKSSRKYENMAVNAAVMKNLVAVKKRLPSGRGFC